MMDYADVIAEITATDGTMFRVILEPDQDAQDPRKDYDQAGVMYVRDQRYYIVPQEADMSIPQMDAHIADHDFRVLARWLRMVHGAAVVLPLYDRSGNGGFSVSAGEATDTPEAGDYVGVIYDVPRTREIAGWSADEPEMITRGLQAEVQEWAAWAEGETYGAIVQRGEVDEDGDVVEWAEHPDDDVSCWNLIGREWAEQFAREEALAPAVAAYNREVALRAAQEASDAAEIDSLRLAELGIPASV